MSADGSESVKQPDDASGPSAGDLERSKVVDSLIMSGVFSRPDAEAILRSPAVVAAFSSPACVAALTSANAIAALSSPCVVAVVLSPVDESWLSGSTAVGFFSSSERIETLMRPRTVEAVASSQVVKEVSRKYFAAAISSLVTISCISAVAILTQHPTFVSNRFIPSTPTTQARSNPEGVARQEGVVGVLDLFEDPGFLPFLTNPHIMDLFSKKPEYVEILRNMIEGEPTTENECVSIRFLRNKFGEWSVES